MKTKDLTHGDISPKLIYLALPLLLGNILQQFYNTSDSLIIGHFLGTKAFASTGISGSVMNLFIFVINGFCVGLSIIFSRCYGKGDRKLFRRSFFMTLITGAVISLLLSTLSLIFLVPLLKLIQTPDTLLFFCRQYLQIILIGLIFTYLYNFLSTVLRSVGDTAAALLALFLSILLNILLDYLFIGIFGMGIYAAASATVIAQSLSALYCFFYIRRKYPELLFTKEDMVFSASIIKESLRFGLISALHQSSLYIGKLLVQGAVNTLGTEGIAAYTAVMRIEGITNSFGDSGNQALSIFISQNKGAGNTDRMKKGFQAGLKLLLLLGAFMSALMYLTSAFCLGFFLEETETKAQNYGTSYLKIIACFYILCFLGNVYVGYFRGIGKVMLPFIGTTLHLSLRVLLSWLLVGKLGLSAIAIATGCGWILVACFHTLCYLKLKKQGRAYNP